MVLMHACMPAWSYFSDLLFIFLNEFFRFAIKVESGSDDPDNLDHLIGSLFGGSSGSYPQIELSGCA